jgi:hypothetical protein
MKLKGYCGVHKSLLLHPILMHWNPVYIFYILILEHGQLVYLYSEVMKFLLEIIVQIFWQ